MRFTTLTFLLFFVAVYIIYWAGKDKKARLWILLTSSMVFYAAWSIGFFIHFFAFVGISYIFIRLLRRKKSTPVLVIAITVNLLNLFFFKYFYLFLKIVFDTTGVSFFQTVQFNDWLFQATGYAEITLPLAISFYTFQILAFIIDVYRGQVEEETSFIEFAVFILFFPQLVAGPIMRHSDFFGQLDNSRPNEKQLVQGSLLLLTGLIKKVVIADNISKWILPVFTSPEKYDSLSTTVAIIGYTARVYCDFSGYTDIARGLGKTLGLELPENFKAPYLATSVRDLWTRWHITLATWLRDYLYIPLGGSRKGEWRTHLNTFITFTLGGLWHGANYTFVVWGAWHGILLAIERIVTKNYTRFSNPKSWRPLRITLTFVAFAIGAGIFNAPDMSRGIGILTQSISFSGGLRMDSLEPIVGLFIVTMFFNYLQLKELKLPESRLMMWALPTCLCIATVFLLGKFAPGGGDFIYFQF